MLITTLKIYHPTVFYSIRSKISAINIYDGHFKFGPYNNTKNECD